LARATLISAIEPDRFQHSDHLPIEMAGVERIAFRLPLRKEIHDVEAHSWLQWDYKTVHAQIAPPL
jgi:hypothetical protein